MSERTAVRMKSVVVISVAALILCSASLVDANFEDNRCRCICPSTEYFSPKANNMSSAEKKKDGQSRRYYTMTNINPLSCNTQTVVKDTARSLVDEQRLDAFLANCSCRFESRNSVLLKVVVIFVICTLFGLTSYMAYLMVVDPMLRRRGRFVAYRRQENDVGGYEGGVGVNTFWFANESWDPSSPRRGHHGRHHHRPFNDSSTSSGSDDEHREPDEEENEEEENDHTIEENIFSRSAASAPLPPAPRGSLSSEESEDQSQHGELNGGRQPPMGRLSISPSKPSGMAGGMLDRLGEEQAKWQNDVKEQRRNVIEHSILN